MKNASISYITIALCILGVAMVIIGILTGEHMSVLNKSIRICLECIGIG